MMMTMSPVDKEKFNANPHFSFMNSIRNFSSILHIDCEMSNEMAKLTLPNGDVFEFPVLQSSLGPNAIDFRSLYATTGLFSYDPGFTSTCSCHSEITFIDGPKGQLWHRGYDISDLAEFSTFEEASYLLLHGELPSRRELSKHTKALKNNLMVHQKLLEFYRGFKSDAHPMAIMYDFSLIDLTYV